MSSSHDKNRVAEALDYLRKRNEFFEFDDRERVVQVAVYRAENADEIAAHVGNLVDLETLTFSRTDLTDRGLECWARLVHLRELWIGGSKITAAGLSCLAAMSQLEKLYIENASHLDRTAFELIAVVTSLRRLSLRGGHYNDSDVSPLAALVNLEKLTISENEQINGKFCCFLTGLPHLRELSPGQNVTDSGIVKIAGLPRLETLFLKGPFSDSGLAQIHTLKRLKTLYVTSERATAKGLAVVADLPALRTLGLHGVLSADICIPVLTQCNSLTRVTFVESRLSERGRRQLRRALPDCEISEPGRQ